MIIVINKTAINLDNVIEVHWFTWEDESCLRVEYIKGYEDFKGEFANRLWMILEMLSSRLMREA